MRRIAIKLSIALTGLGVAFGVDGAAVDQLGTAVKSYHDGLERRVEPSGGVMTINGIVCKRGVFASRSIVSPTFFMMNIGCYSASNNVEKVDYPLDDAFFASLEATLAEARKRGGMIGIRFRYDGNGKRMPEPDWPNLIGHFKAIRDSGLFQKYGDVISWCELGTLGAYGEQHSTRYGDYGYSTELIDLYLQIMPEDAAILLRTTGRIMRWVNDKLGTKFNYSDIDQMREIVGRNYAEVRNCRADYVSGDGEDFTTGNSVAKDLARLGIYNDGYMGTQFDYGTFKNRETETAFLAGQGSVPYGGEFSGDRRLQIVYGGLNPVWWPTNAIPEMYYTHLNYLHSAPWKEVATFIDFDTRAKAEEWQRKAEELYQILGRDDLRGTTVIKSRQEEGSEKSSYRLEYTAPGYEKLRMDASVAEAVNRKLKLATPMDLRDYYGQDLSTFIYQHTGYRFVVRSSSLEVARTVPGESIKLNLTLENTGFSAPERAGGCVLILRHQSDQREIVLDNIDIREWLPGTHQLKLSAEVKGSLAKGEWEVFLRVAFGPGATGGAIRFANESMFNEEVRGNLVARFTVK